MTGEAIPRLKSRGMGGYSPNPSAGRLSLAMADKDDIRQQLHDAFAGADYPVSSPMDLVPALPNGPSTTFESGDVSFTAMELNSQAGSRQEFPYENVDPLVEDIMAGLEDEGYFEGG